MDHPLTPDHFRPHLGGVFHADGGPDLTLASISEGGAGSERPPGLREPFHLIFSGPPQPLLPQGVHRLTAEGGEAIALFIVPIQTFAHDRQDYQVVFA